jgi:hypothetical protein
MRQRQLELFTRSELASMRDRTRARNYSPEAEQYRLDHKRHRDWGLAQRYGRRLMELRHQGDPLALAASKAGGWQAPALSAGGRAGRRQARFSSLSREHRLAGIDEGSSGIKEDHAGG